MKRTFILFQLLIIGCTLFAQSQFTEYYKKPAFIVSKYKDCCSPLVLKMQSRACILIDKSAVEFGGNAASSSFKIEVDPDSVYDCSYKIYSAQFSNCSISYTTYFWADELSITYNNKKYSLSCIDGGMDVHIKPLSHHYRLLENGEELRIDVTDDFPLTAKDRSQIILKRGSFFIFRTSDQ